jgi:hypothetical protein
MSPDRSSSATYHKDRARPLTDLDAGIEDSSAVLYLPDGLRYRRTDVPTARESQRRPIIITGAFPEWPRHPDVLVETIRDCDNPNRLVFLVWQNGSATLHPQIEINRQVFLRPDPTLRSFPSLSLADGFVPCDELAALLAEIACTISKFVKLRREDLLIVACFVLTTWFTDCLNVAPYLWVVGPLGSAKSTLLRLLWSLRRRAVLAGDLRAASVYRLVDTWHPTLIIDELEGQAPS